MRAPPIWLQLILITPKGSPLNTIISGDRISKYEFWVDANIQFVTDSKRIICSNLLLWPNEMFLHVIEWNLELQALGRKGTLVGTWSQSFAHRGLTRTYCTLSTPPHWSLYMCPLISWLVAACHPHSQVPDLGTPYKEFKAVPSRSLFHEEAQDMVKVRGITRACPLFISLLRALSELAGGKL